MTQDVAIVGCPEGDWEALYVNGLKVDEGHSLQLRNVLEKLGIQAEFKEVSVDDDSYAEFPTNLSDCQF